MKISDEDIPFLQSNTARKIRSEYDKRLKQTFEALMSAAMESTDPKVRGLATSFATWKEAQKELQYNEPE